MIRLIVAKAYQTPGRRRKRLAKATSAGAATVLAVKSDIEVVDSSVDGKLLNSDVDTLD